MQTTPDEPLRRRRRLLTAFVALLLGLSGLVACSDDARPTPFGGDRASGTELPEDLAASFGRTLRKRARALRQHDLGMFLHGIDRSDEAFVTAQRGYFDNLVQLPLERFGYRLDRASMVREGDQYWVVVRVTTQLRGFDAVPVVTRDRFRFAAVEGTDRYVVSSVTDRAWEAANDVRAQPWDLVPVHVRTAPGVLGVFDDGSVGASGALMESMSDGVSQVSVQVPYDWPGSVVFYALSDTTFLRSLDDLPGGDPETVDGVAFPVAAGPGRSGTAGVRVAFHPDVLDEPGPERDRLVRHELVHVALGERDDEVPVWLSEGIAEWVSVQPIPREQRRLSEEALDEARAGVRAMPGDDTFNGDQSAAHYGLSWWACEYLVRSFGEESLWRLLDELADEQASPSATLQALFGLDVDMLARRGARLMLATYAPGSLPRRSPSPSPTSPSPSPPTPTETPTTSAAPNGP